MSSVVEKIAESMRGIGLSTVYGEPTELNGVHIVPVAMSFHLFGAGEGRGNGGGAYQFVLGTWENYGGSASEYGVAGPAYQDQIFDNAIAAGGASNWTAYDGC